MDALLDHFVAERITDGFIETTQDVIGADDQVYFDPKRIEYAFKLESNIAAADIDHASWQIL